MERTVAGYGAPVLTMEIAIGRASRKSVVLGYTEVETVFTNMLSSQD